MSKPAVRYALVGLVLLAGLLLACSAKPLPADKLEYAGFWVTGSGEDANVQLSITADGHVDYEKQSGSTSSTMNGPIQGYEGNDFTVGVGCVSSTFEVSETPNQLEDGSWTMVVDGRRLYRVR